MTAGLRIVVRRRTDVPREPISRQRHRSAGVALGCVAFAFGDFAVSPRCRPHTLCLLAGAMDIAESLADLLCHVRVAFVFFGSLLVNPSRSLGGAHGA